MLKDRLLKYIISGLHDVPTTLSVGMMLFICVGAILLMAFMGRKGLKWSTGLLLLVYLFLLLFLAVLVRSSYSDKMYKCTPFWSYKAFLSGSIQVLVEIIANIAAFIPVGLLLGCAFCRMQWWKVLLIGGGFSLLIEALQFFLKRGFAEFDDVFHNVIGCAIGFGVYLGVRWLIRQISPLAGARSK